LHVSWLEEEEELLEEETTVEEAVSEETTGAEEEEELLEEETTVEEAVSEETTGAEEEEDAFVTLQAAKAKSERRRNEVLRNKVDFMDVFLSLAVQAVRHGVIEGSVDRFGP